MNLYKSRSPLLPLKGGNFRVKTLSGKSVCYLNLDNAATTPTSRDIFSKVGDFLDTYGSVFRGSGIKSQISTEIFEQALAEILDFAGVSSKNYCAMFAHNTTATINKLARMLHCSREDSVFVSEFEHSSNDIPWRGHVRVIVIPSDNTGRIDLDRLQALLRKKSGGGRKLVAVTGASNITGLITPIHKIAQIAHSCGAYIMVDAAQLVAHRAINMRGADVSESVDFLCFSGHKMYAPFGAGVLIAKKNLVESVPPDDVGGGNLDFVMRSSFDLAENFPKRSLSGTPNAVGVIAMALSCRMLKHQIGFKAILNHEREILSRLKQTLSGIPAILTYGDYNYDAKAKCAVFAFNIENMNPGLVAARLGHEFGIGVRHGAICQYSYVAELLGLSQAEIKKTRASVLAGKQEAMYGIVRASFGLGNTVQDVDRLLEAIEEIKNTPQKARNYYVNSAGLFWPRNKSYIAGSFFKLIS